MRQRVVEPEWLDELPPDDPAAVRGRLDLRRINFLMGNERWILRTMKRIPVEARGSITEWGAGDGSLCTRMTRAFPDSRMAACDLAPRPGSMNEKVDWHQGNLLESAPVVGGVLVANLFLHHFEREALHTLGRKCEGFDVLLFNEPDRTRLARGLGTLLHPFLHPLTRHDMQVSIRAGFQRGELVEFMGLDPARWIIRETSSWRGARRVLALRA